MGNKMQEYYQTQALTLRDVFMHSEDQLRDFCTAHRAVKRICIVGSGSSYYCGRMTAPYLKQAVGCEVAVLLPDRVDPLGSREGDAYLLISQEGKSVNVMRAADRLDACGVPFSVLTAVADSPTARRAQYCVDMRCGQEQSGPKTLGVLATLVLLTRMGLELGAQRGVLSPEAHQTGMDALRQRVESLPGEAEKSLAWVRGYKSFFMEAPFCAVLGVAPMCFLADEGVLKLEETLYLPAVSFEFEEFIHGPHCLLGQGFHMIALYHGLPGEERLRVLCAFAREKGCEVLEISDQEEGPDFEGLRIGNVKASGCPFSFLLPFQAAGAFLSEEMGHDLNKPKFEGFATRLNSKLY